MGGLSRTTQWTCKEPSVTQHVPQPSRREGDVGTLIMPHFGSGHTKGSCAEAWSPRQQGWGAGTEPRPSPACQPAVPPGAGGLWRPGNSPCSTAAMGRRGKRRGPRGGSQGRPAAPRPPHYPGPGMAYSSGHPTHCWGGEAQQGDESGPSGQGQGQRAQGQGRTGRQQGGSQGC